MRGRFSKGDIPWNKGVPMREETKQKLSESKRGVITWNKGSSTGPLSEETRQKISTALKGRETTLEHRANLSKALKGRKAPWAADNWTQDNKKVSCLTYRLAEVLMECGFGEVAIEQSFWPYTVDVLLLDEWVAFEADGKYWHNSSWLRRSGRTPNKLTSTERDQRLFDKYQLPIVHLSEDEVNKLYIALIK
ncbi:hypothetical protein LCGC14_2652240 [marine sediment metagenome]|uniref:Nuclease associated modular domain-containing protein n=1 Tax=marine sediment metagenome TaxID=412755 RepID=A0A0F9C4U3_9ZZZZ